MDVLKADLCKFVHNLWREGALTSHVKLSNTFDSCHRAPGSGVVMWHNSVQSKLVLMRLLSSDSLHTLLNLSL